MNQETTPRRPPVASVLHALETNLRAEQQALLAQNVARLAELALAKGELLQQLDRARLAHASTRSGDAGAADPEVLATLHRCRALSLANQGLIERGRRQVEIALRMLRGGETAQCYSRRADANARPFGGGRTLATV